MAIPALQIVSREQGNNLALKDGSIHPAGFSFTFEEVPVLVHAFRRMVRTLEFEVCEMALTTYLCARDHGGVRDVRALERECRRVSSCRR